ncbi:MAG: ABC transporter permease [Cyclobacteriaceae bacterium]
MIKNYLTIAFRHLLKNKIFSLINILGLAISMAACLLIFQYVNFELSYDDFHEKANRIYRVRFDRIYPDKHDQSAGLTAAAGPALKEEFSEIEAYTKLWSIYGNNILSLGDKKFKEDRLYFADSSFFSIFSYPLLKGDPATALADPNTIVLTTSTAQKYFGEEDPMGKFLDLFGPYGRQSFLVTGIARDLPENTHFKFNALCSFQTLVNATQGRAADAWSWNAFLTYLLVSPETDVRQLEAKLPAFVEKYYGPMMAKQDVQGALLLQSLPDIHLHSHLRFEAEPNGNAEVVTFLIIIAVFTLFIAWVNYINLSTAKSAERAREIGIRKVAGAYKNQLIGQYLLEALLLNLLSLVLAFTIVQITSPYFEMLTGKPLTLNFWKDDIFWGILAGVAVLSTLLTGVYPAFLLSSFIPVKVLKGNIAKSTRGILVRKGLVIFQYVMSAILITATLVIFQQLQYMQDEKLGFDQKQMLIVEAPSIADSTYGNRQNNFKMSVLSNSDIYQMTVSTSIPGEEIGWVNNGVGRQGSDPEERTSCHFIQVDDDFFETYQIDLIAGRNFSQEFGNEASAVILNKATVDLLGFESAEKSVGQELYVDEDTFHIVGVAPNYHQQSLNQEYYPMVFHYSLYGRAYYSLKVNTRNLSETLPFIEKQWDTDFGENPFQYFFLDDFFNRQYQSDQQFARAFTLFSGLAIFIACLGLYGLSAYTAVQRTKEIAVRKVLGASVSGLLALLARSFLKLILLASLIAIPIAYTGMQRWLADYAFRVSISIWLLLVPMVAILLIALLTISVQTVRAASANPVKSLRYE